MSFRQQKMNYRALQLAVAAASVVVGSGFCGAAPVNGEWNIGSSTTATYNWGVASNWKGSTIASGAGAFADLTKTDVASGKIQTITLDDGTNPMNVTLGRLDMADSNSSDGARQLAAGTAGGTGGTLTFDGTGMANNAAVLNMRGAVGWTSVGAPVYLATDLYATFTATADAHVSGLSGSIKSRATDGSTQTLTVASFNDKRVVISGVLSDGTTAPDGTSTNGHIALVLNTATGAGGSFPRNLDLGSATANTYTGGTQILGGRVRLMGNDALGSGYVTVNTTGTPNTTTAILNLNGKTDTVGTVTVDGGGQIVGAGTLTSTGTFEMKNGSVAAILAGLVPLNKTTANTVVLSGVNTYSGATNITGGVLEIASTGRINSTSGITIDGGELKYNSATALNRPVTFTSGKISGSGAIGSAITAGTGAILSPGNSPGTQSYTAGLTWSDGGTYLWEINSITGTAGTNWDRITVTGGLTVPSTGTFDIDIAALAGMGDAPLIDTSWGILGYDNLVGTFDPARFNLVSSNLNPTWTGSWSISDDSANHNIMLTYSVPEPGTVMLAAASAGLLLVRRRVNR